jgi:hypothetical protein
MGCEMRDDDIRDSFQEWKRERDAIEQEMKLFLAAGRRASIEDRQARQSQFAALIERRNAAIRNLLQSASPIHRSMIGATRGQTATMRPPSPQTAEEVAGQGAESAVPRAAEEVAEQGAEPAAPPIFAEEVAEQFAEPAAPRAAEEVAEQGTEPAAKRWLAAPPSAYGTADK